jgi:hypothetical protein
MSNPSWYVVCNLLNWFLICSLFRGGFVVWAVIYLAPFVTQVAARIFFSAALIYLFNTILAHSPLYAQTCSLAFSGIKVVYREPETVYRRDVSFYKVTRFINGEPVEGYSIPHEQIYRPKPSHGLFLEDSLRTIGGVRERYGYFIPAPSRIRLPGGLKFVMATPEYKSGEFYDIDYARALSEGVVLISTKQYIHDMTVHGPGFAILAGTSLWPRITGLLKRAFLTADNNPELRSSIFDGVILKLTHILEIHTPQLHRSYLTGQVAPVEKMNNIKTRLKNYEEKLASIEAQISTN